MHSSIILICHPEPTMRRVLQRMLRTLLPNAELREVENRDGALEVVAQTELSALVVDSRMIAGPGEALLAAAGKRSRGLPVIILARSNWRGQLVHTGCAPVAVSSLYELQRSIATISNESFITANAVGAGRAIVPSAAQLTV